MMMTPPASLPVPGDRLRSLRLVVVLDPRQPAVPPDAPPETSLHLHLATLADLDVTGPFLRRADVLIVEVLSGDPGQLSAFAQLVADPTRPVIAAGRNLTASDVRALMRAGATDVLAIPFEQREVAEALGTARAALATGTGSTAKGRVVTFMRAVGGAGATALACQAGCLWAGRQTTCLIDFDVQFGAVSLYLDLHPALSLLDLVEAIDRLDHTLFGTIAVRHASGVHVVAAPAEAAPLELLDPAIVGQILAIAAQSFDIVLVDLPSAWTSWSLAALAQSDAACLVTTLSVPGLRQARRLLDLIEANQVTTPLKIVLNRVPKKIFRTIDLKDSERVLRRPVDFTIANDWTTMSSALDQGRPIGAVRPRSAIEGDLNAMIDGLVAVVAT